MLRFDDAALLEILRCPRTGQRLVLAGDAYVTSDGRMRYPILHGIPDFRTRDWVYRDDPGRTAELAAAVETQDYRGLIRQYFGLKDGADVADRERFTEYHEAGEERGADRWQDLTDLFRLDPRGRVALDLGCGGGGNARWLARRFDYVLAVEVDMAKLILTRRGAEEAGFGDRVIPIAANAEALPFADDSVDFANAINVVEHLADQQAGLISVACCLRPGGVFYFDSPNRFTLLPEPHVKLWGASWLPRAWADRYVRMLKGVPYEGKRLLSIRELRLLITHAFLGGQREIVVPTFRRATFGRDSRAKALLRSAYNRIFRDLPLISRLLFYVVPTYLVLVRKAVREEREAWRGGGAGSATRLAGSRRASG